MAWPLSRSLDRLPLLEPPSTMGATAYDVDRPPVKLGSVPDSAPLIGRRIDHFEVRGLLGQGGMGTVYLAHDLSLERPVAIKVLRRELASDAHLVGRLMLEARAQARLQHPNVVTIYHIGTYERAPYFAMEYVHGKTLADRVEIDGPLPWAEALEYVIQTTRALMTAHARGVVHRDIKPSNLILDGAPGAGSAGAAIKVADFGLAAAPGSAEKDFVGSPFYASPEQIAGESPSFRSDIYALGITFHELLTGSPPFQAQSLRKMRSLHLHAPRPTIAARQAPWRLRQLITEMMDPDRFKRPGTYEELLERLESLRPRPPVAGGVAARSMALALDLTFLGVLGEGLSRLGGLPTRLAHPLALLLFAAYYVVGHRFWGKTVGKRLLRLRIQGTNRPVTIPGLALRFVVEFWAPLTAALMPLAALPGATGSGLGLPVVDQLLRMVQVPTLPLALPWVCGFLFALSGEQSQALHDRAAHTRVIYELRPRS
jgi:uncharacterized RDD family membrane protein YckC